jgi:hypothetical protein
MSTNIILELTDFELIEKRRLNDFLLVRHWCHLTAEVYNSSLTQILVVRRHRAVITKVEASEIRWNCDAENVCSERMNSDLAHAHFNCLSKLSLLFTTLTSPYYLSQVCVLCASVASPVVLILLCATVASPVVLFLLCATVASPGLLSVLCASVASPVVLSVLCATVASPVVLSVLCATVASPVVLK